MNRLFCGFLAATLALSGGALLADTFGSGANSFDIDFVTVGNPGNPPDTTGKPNPAGAVPYAYRIGKYEISEQMIDKANVLSGLGITKDARGADKPATSVSWYEAAKFVNWLNTSTGSMPAYKFDVSGNFQLWTLIDPGYDPTNPYRNRLAKYFMPSVNEWYKAAYYDPAAGTYYDYPTGSDMAPVSVSGGTVPQTAVYGQDLSIGPADITQAGGLSPYRTLGQGGNVDEWNETDFRIDYGDLGARAVRGGDWFRSLGWLSPSAVVGDDGPFAQFPEVGFRISSTVPEPSAILLLCAGWMVLVFIIRL